MWKKRSLWILGAAMLVLARPVLAQDEEKPAGGEKGGGPAAGAKDKKKPEIQPYDKVITKDAKSDPGVFMTHKVDDKLFYEIPASEIAEDFLSVVQIAKTQSGFGYGGTGVRNRVVRWERRDNDILLRDIKYKIRAGAEDAVKNAVEATSMAPIIATFPIKAFGKDQSTVIDVTDLFLDDTPEFSAKSQLDASARIASASFLDEVKSFPDNIETKIMMTYRLNAGGPKPGGDAPAPRRGGDQVRRDPSQGGVTVQLHHSMVRLPAVPMKPRIRDARVGYFGVSFEEYGAKDQEVEKIEYISRWRLEKKDPAAAISEPKKPIVFYVGRGVPDQWKPWVKKGIEAWQPAFEAAGFKNAIIAKDAPTPQEDPDWDGEDARYSTIQWLPSTIENAMGPHIADPRTGEILEADIIIYHNVLKLARDWYFVQASPNDERAQQLPLPDDLMGELLAYVISHEVGHSLGFPHNMKGSNAYTVEQLRDPAFTAANGTEASIMDYGRFNYVAQPGDGARLIPKIGPYDFFAIDWGYREIPDAKTPAAEKIALAALTVKQEKNVTLRFGDPNPGVDPTQQTEDLGSDAIKATTLGLKNLERVAGYLIQATCKPGEDYDLLRNMYDELVNQRNRELGHVANVVGGVVENRLWFGQADQVYSPIAKEKQKEAIAFLNEHAFKAPPELIDSNILSRLEANGAPDRIVNAQRKLLATLVNEDRVKRMAELSSRDAANGYAPLDMVRDLNVGIFAELTNGLTEIDLYRRNLQRAFVDVLTGMVAKESSTSDLPAIARGELETIRAGIERRLAQHRVDTSIGATMTDLHLRDVSAKIKKALDAKDDTFGTLKIDPGTP